MLASEPCEVRINFYNRLTTTTFCFPVTAGRKERKKFIDEGIEERRRIYFEGDTHRLLRIS